MTMSDLEMLRLVDDVIRAGEAIGWKSCQARTQGEIDLVVALTKLRMMREARR